MKKILNSSWLAESSAVLINTVPKRKYSAIFVILTIFAEDFGQL